MAGVTSVPGFFGGRFRKGGQGTADVAVSADLGRMTKDELVALAKERDVSHEANATKAQIVEAIRAAEAG